ENARKLAKSVGLVTIVLAAAFLVWTVVLHLDNRNIALIVTCAAIAAAALVGGWLAHAVRRDGCAFARNTVTTAWARLTPLAALFPNLMLSEIDPAYSMSVAGAASSEKTLELMTWVAVFTMPLVLAYQAWTYWVFRKRLSHDMIPPAQDRVQPEGIASA